ncbi:hypothetical protein GCM10009039_26390 [Halocalculus aciditolerans]|uniref:Uncharacterized protein n=2 Tax=Halocalculus aciditolerans TaxID=1383812 RepID=A0A830F695_9EURY|nr:hypothetical protein GCM10009039_26390 [Halocalculus aciditolerans]
MDYVSGDDNTNNKHLAEALDMTREGSAPPDGTTGYDEQRFQGDVETLRDSCFHVAIEELQKIESASGENQEDIDRVIEMLQNARYANDERRAQVMAEAHDILQDVWVPPK